jgi:hypothetical protein
VHTFLFHHRVRFDAKPRSGSVQSKSGRHSLSSLNRWKGRRRAAFWRKLGFPNLVRARAAKARKREERIKRETLELARRVNPFAFPEDAELWASVARRNVRASGHKADSLALPRKKTPNGY